MRRPTFCVTTLTWCVNTMTHCVTHTSRTPQGLL
jgi:hypothetical protein